VLIVACLELVVIACLAALLYGVTVNAQAERRELLDRIQRPDLLPSRPAAQIVVPTPEPDESHLVGMVMPSIDEDQ